MKNWEHSGFSIDNDVYVEKEDKKEDIILKAGTLKFKFPVNSTNLSIVPKNRMKFEWLSIFYVFIKG